MIWLDRGVVGRAPGDRCAQRWRAFRAAMRQDGDRHRQDYRHGHADHLACPQQSDLSARSPFRQARVPRGAGPKDHRQPTVDRPLQRIREFRNRPNPAIVVTVDMLSTGVDIPDLEFIVFLRPVKSRILFEQMLGRGTRKGERFPDKSHFTVFDCFDGSLLEYFRKASAFTREPPEKPSRTLQEIIEDIWQNRDRDYSARCLVKRLQRIDKEMSGEARALFAAFIPDGDLLRDLQRVQQVEVEHQGQRFLLRSELAGTAG